MAVSLESLPNEILDDVISYLIGCHVGYLRDPSHIVCSEIARLSRCSRFWDSTLERVLYFTLNAQYAAVEHDIRNNNLDSIRKAVTCGASPDYIYYWGTSDYPSSSTTPTKVGRQTLALALDTKELEPFKLFLELGANLIPHDANNAMESTYIREQRTHILDSMLSTKEYEAFLIAYLDARTDTPFWPGPRSDNISHAYVLVTSLQFTSLVSWAGSVLLERLIEEGACLSSVECLLTTWKYGCGTHLTPLAAACVRGDPQVFDLLRRRGAQMYARHGSE